MVYFQCSSTLTFENFGDGACVPKKTPRAYRRRCKNSQLSAGYKKTNDNDYTVDFLRIYHKEFMISIQLTL